MEYIVDDWDVYMGTSLESAINERAREGWILISLSMRSNGEFATLIFGKNTEQGK